MADFLEAPWTPEQVENLNSWQASNYIHPYTCGDCRATLLATERGWVCPAEGCDYTQSWALAEMLTLHASTLTPVFGGPVDE